MHSDKMGVSNAELHGARGPTVPAGQGQMLKLRERNYLDPKSMQNNGLLWVLGHYFTYFGGFG